MFLKVMCNLQKTTFFTQIMGNLPGNRLGQLAPFENCGMHAFGSYTVSEGISTHRHSSARKCWCLLFTCFVSRAFHTEVLPRLDVG